MTTILTRVLLLAPFAVLLVAAYLVALIVEGLADLTHRFRTQ
jgi:hypothetical protein